MSHLLLLDVPGGNDFTILEDAARMGHQVTFVTSDLDQYRRQGDAANACLALARTLVEVRPFSYAALEQRALTIHAETPFDAVLCILDIRIVEASMLAARLGLPFLNVATTRLARDKFSVREALARKGVRQPRFALAANAGELRNAVSEIGFPVLVKPSDGYGSQNVSVLFSEDDLEGLVAAVRRLESDPTDYGLGIRANNRFLVERYVRGHMIGCDVFSRDNERVFLGINDKLMYAPPSFAIRGSCFPSDRYDTDAIRDYAFEVLGAMNFDFGACHIEMIVADDGPYLVEVNPRLVSAQIPFQMGYALGRSVYADLIDLHLGRPLDELRSLTPSGFCAIRWIITDRCGTLRSIALPDEADPSIRRVVLFKAAGDGVRPPINNGDRIGYVMALGETADGAERAAEAYVRNSVVHLN